MSVLQMLESCFEDSIIKRGPGLDRVDPRGGEQIWKHHVERLVDVFVHYSQSEVLVFV